MPSKHDPADNLADIIENAERIEGYLAGMDREAFERDGRATPWNAAWSGCARPHTGWERARPS